MKIFNYFNVFISLSAVSLVLFSCSSISTEPLTNTNKLFTPPSEMLPNDWKDKDEIERAWQASLVRTPKGSGEFYSMTMGTLDNEAILGKKFPTIIHMHGCAGFIDSSYSRIDFVASNGFAVIAPNSFARNKYPQSCDVSTSIIKTAMYRGTIDMRQFDAGYAIEKARSLPWVDTNNVFLMGHSEGAVVVAIFKSKTAPVNARIIEGWTCTTVWEEANGLKAPETEPVLAMVGKDDPIVQNEYTSGQCKVEKNNGSKSILYEDALLSNQHDLLVYKDVQTTVLEFLRLHTN